MGSAVATELDAYVLALHHQAGVQAVTLPRRKQGSGSFCGLRNHGLLFFNINNINIIEAGDSCRTQDFKLYQMELIKGLKES